MLHISYLYRIHTVTFLPFRVYNIDNQLIIHLELSLWHILCDDGSSSFEKKSFFCFLPSHPHTCGSSALFIGVSRVRVSVRANFYPHTFAPSLLRQEPGRYAAVASRLSSTSVTTSSIRRR